MIEYTLKITSLWLFSPKHIQKLKLYAIEIIIKEEIFDKLAYLPVYPKYFTKYLFTILPTTIVLDL